MTLTRSLLLAWSRKAAQALQVINGAAKAPALFKPDAVEQARRDYAHARRQAERQAELAKDL